MLRSTYTTGTTPLFSREPPSLIEIPLTYLLTIQRSRCLK